MVQLSERKLKLTPASQDMLKIIQYKQKNDEECHF